MSDNLAFNKSKQHNYVFPYQTPTRVTDKVLSAKTKAEQLELIRQDLVVRGWDDWAQERFKYISSALREGAILIRS